MDIIKSRTPSMSHRIERTGHLLKRVWVVVTAAVLAAGAQAAPLSDYVAKAELGLIDRPQVSRSFSFTTAGTASPNEQATLELVLGDEVAEMLVESSKALALHVQPKDPSFRVHVRERTVIYMNLSDEGPHWPVYTTEQRSRWHQVARLGAHRFKVGGLPEPALRLSHRDLLKAVMRSRVGKDPRSVALARECPSADQGACYTVTDNEYEITISQLGRVVARGLLRVRQPAGC